MTQASQSERMALLIALEDLAELERDREHRRRESLAQMDRAEQAARAAIADPGPLVRRGEIVRDEAGQIVPNETIRRRAQQELERVRRERTRLTGASDVGE